MTQFNRYDGADAGAPAAEIRMPQDELGAKAMSLPMSEVLGRLEDFTPEERAKYPWTDRFVMGYPLPSWQRPLVWTLEQSTRFIRSIWEGVDIGSYLVNDIYEFVNTPQGPVFKEFSDVLLDGQQRLSAIEGYVLNKFAVPDEQGVLRYWRDLPRVERRRFGNYHFARATLKSWDEGLLRKAYDLRALGGTPHQPDQRATQPEAGAAKA